MQPEILRSVVKFLIFRECHFKADLIEQNLFLNSNLSDKLACQHFNSAQYQHMIY